MSDRVRTQTNIVIHAAQQYINSLEAMLLSCIDFMEEKGIAEEYGIWLSKRVPASQSKE